MKQFRVNEYGVDVYVQPFGKPNNDYVIKPASDDYTRYSNYFEDLMEVIGEGVEDVDLVLNVTSEATLMTLYLKDEQLSMAEEIKSKLFEKFSDYIEQIGIVGNEMNIMDFFFDYRG